MRIRVNVSYRRSASESIFLLVLAWWGSLWRWHDVRVLTSILIPASKYLLRANNCGPRALVYNDLYSWHIVCVCSTCMEEKKNVTMYTKYIFFGDNNMVLRRQNRSGRRSRATRNSTRRNRSRRRSRGMKYESPRLRYRGALKEPVYRMNAVDTSAESTGDTDDMTALLSQADDRKQNAIMTALLSQLDEMKFLPP